MALRATKVMKMRDTVGQAPRLRTGALAGPPAAGRQGVRLQRGGFARTVKHSPPAAFRMATP